MPTNAGQILDAFGRQTQSGIVNRLRAKSSRNIGEDCFREDVMSFLSTIGFGRQLSTILESEEGCQRVAIKCGIHIPTTHQWALDKAIERQWFQYLAGSCSNLWSEIQLSTSHWSRDEAYHISESVEWVLQKLEQFHQYDLGSSSSHGLSCVGRQALIGLNWLSKQLPGFAVEYQPVINSLCALNEHGAQQQISNIWKELTYVESRTAVRFTQSVPNLAMVVPFKT